MAFWKSRSECIQILTDVITSGGRKSDRVKLFVLECQLECFPCWGVWSRSFTSSTDNEEVCDTMSSLYKRLLALRLFTLAHRRRGCLAFQQRVTCIFQRCRESRKVEAQMCVCGGGPFDCGPESIHVVCSAWWMMPSVSVTANIGPETHQLSEAGTETRVPRGL